MVTIQCMLSGAGGKIIESLQYFDSRVHEKLTDHRLSYLDGFFAAVTGLGSIYLAIVLMVVTFVLKPFWLYSIVPGFVLMTALVFFLKQLFDRDKPGDSALTLDLTKSFPSGHSASSTFLAVSFSSLNPELSVLLYALACIVCISRVYLGAHYPSDVVAGAFLGGLIALVV